MHVKFLITERVSLSKEIDLMWTERIKASLQCLSCQHLVWLWSMSRWVLPPAFLLLACRLRNSHLFCHQLPVYPVENHLSRSYISPFPIKWEY